MKKNYSKPSMQVFNLKQRQMILCGSNGEPSGEPKRRGAPSDYDDNFAFTPGDASDMNSIA